MTKLPICEQLRARGNVDKEAGYIVRAAEIHKAAAIIDELYEALRRIGEGVVDGASAAKIARRALVRARGEQVTA